MRAIYEKPVIELEEYEQGVTADCTIEGNNDMGEDEGTAPSDMSGSTDSTLVS